ncbi:hypothetical protein [Pantoea ananatis]
MIAPVVSEVMLTLVINGAF